MSKSNELNIPSLFKENSDKILIELSENKNTNSLAQSILNVPLNSIKEQSNKNILEEDINFNIKNLREKNNKNSKNLFITEHCDTIKKKIIKNKYPRKCMRDDIQKKIKSRFHKSLKMCLNKLLKDSGSEMEFDNLPQSFIRDISLKTNSIAMEMTLKEIFLTKYIKNSKDQKKYNNNIQVLEYLNENKNIYESSCLNIFINLKYKEFYNQYLNSIEFSKCIEKLRKENNTQEYINRYIKISQEYILSYQKY